MGTFIAIFSIIFMLAPGAWAASVDRLHGGHVYAADFTAEPCLPDANDKTVITWSYWGNPWEVKVNERIIEVFESENPDIRIRSLHKPWSEYFEHVTPWLESDNPPDVLFLAHIRDYIKQGYLASFEPFLELEKAEGDLNLEDFYPQLLSLFRYQGSLYGFPRDNDTKVIFYNKRLFDRAGLAYPQENWNWQDFYRLADTLTREHEYQYGVIHARDWLPLLFWQNALYLPDDARYSRKDLINSVQGIEALEWFIRLIRRTSPLQQLEVDSYRAVDYFTREKVAMMFGNHALVPELIKHQGISWGVAGLPKGKRRVNKIGGAGYVISEKSRHKAAAWRFVKWLVSQKGQAIFTESGAMVPSRQSVSRSRVFHRLQNEDHARVFIRETLAGLTEADHDDDKRINRIISKYINDVLVHQLPFDDAIEQARYEVD